MEGFEPEGMANAERVHLRVREVVVPRSPGPGLCCLKILAEGRAGASRMVRQLARTVANVYSSVTKKVMMTAKM
jgi:hypothetical protein